MPTSLNATYTHYLPCGSRQGNEEAQKARTAANHDMGVAIHTHFNPMICVNYEPAFSDAEALDALIKDQDGRTYVYDYSTNVENSFPVSQFDFAAENGVSAYETLTDEAIEHGYDGWMEDFGEYTPLDADSEDGATGTKLHTQLYPYIQAAAHEYYVTGMPIMQHHLLTHPGDAQATARDDQYMFGPDILVAPVYVQGATDRELLYLPEGTWVEWWRTVTYGELGGTFDLGAAELHEGMRSVTVAAPIPEIPIFVKAGAVIPMLAPDVFALAEYGDDPEIVHASDRDQLLHVLAFPRGETSGKFYDDGSWTSAEAEGSWTLSMQNGRERTAHLEASTRTLSQPIDVCAVSLDGTTLSQDDWSYEEESNVLDATYTTTSGTLTAKGC